MRIHKPHYSRKDEEMMRATHLYKQYYSHRFFFLMLAPALVYFIVFHYGPIYGVIMAFQDYKVFKGFTGSEWVGFANFNQLFSGNDFWPVLRNTLIINFYKLLLGFPAPILFALMINEVAQATIKKTIQTISYLPFFLSWVILSGLIIEFLSPSRGLINMLLSALGFDPIFFVADPMWFRSILVSSEIWKQVGMSSIIYLAAIAGINPELYEAAEMDGIGRIQKMWTITLPSISPVVVIMLILASGQIINDDFDQIYNLLNASVMDVGNVISTYTYNEGLTKMNYSYASAVGLFKNVVALVMVLIANSIAKRFSENTII